MADLQRIEDLRRRIQRDPASIAFAQLAEELRRAHEYEESVATCRAGLDIHPEYLSARVTLGRALIELNDLDQAQQELERVLRSAPDNLAAIRGLGDIHQRRGDLRQALAHFRSALLLARNDPDLEETVARLSKQVEPEKSAAATDLLSFDQIQHELLKLAPPPMAAASAAQVASAPPRSWRGDGDAVLPELPLTANVLPMPARPTLQSDHMPELSTAVDADVPARDHAERTVAALEQWLEALHVARAHGCS